MDLIVTQSILKSQHTINRSESPRSPYRIRENERKSENLRSFQPAFETYELSDVEECNSVNNQVVTYGNSQKIQNSKSHKKEPKIVEICIIFIKIGEIDTTKERFKANAYIQASWIDNSFSGKERYNPSVYWNPKLRIENAIGDLKQEIFYHVQVDADNHVRITETRNLKGVFWERLELWDFPFDTQELSITVSTYQNETDIKFVQDPQNACAVGTENFTNEQEWHLYNFVRTSQRTINDLWNNYKRPCFTATTLVKRKPGYFIYNAYLMIFFVSSLGFVPFSFEIANHHLRIQVTSLLILTSVNFRWVVTQRLPPVSYLTQLDKYAIITLFFLVLLCAWHAIIGAQHLITTTEITKDQLDFLILIIMSSIFVLYHIIYFARLYVMYSKLESFPKEPIKILNKNETKIKKSENTTNTQRQKSSLSNIQELM